MKTRLGFVTNSSSSSFIIKANSPINENYKKWFSDDITKENYINKILENTWIDTETFGYTGQNKEDVMKLLGIDEKAYILMCMIHEDYELIYDCLELAQYFEKNPNAVLHSITLDWGYEYTNPDLKEFMDECDIVIKNDEG